ncbi:MAG TPA: carbohydrate ABC transporter permease [Trueperaceae bacterium]|nr:carbohydrate ABC transporter permease [Trueperaceae bacterium]
MATAKHVPPYPTIGGSYLNTPRFYRLQLRRLALYGSVTLFASLVLVAFLMPFAYMLVTSFKDRDQIVASARGPVLPVDPVKYEHAGKLLDVVNVEIDGVTRHLALLTKGRQESVFVDPAAPADEPIVWQGSWRTLKPVYEFAPRTGNFAEAWNGIAFPRLLFNTAFIAFTGMVGTLLSCVAVAYAFARFPLPFKGVLFLILIGTIILPKQVLLVPTYAFFDIIGWTGTWLPLIVPHFFANAFNVFLLRQYFLQLPRELDEAAMIDGAGPLRILTSVIIPQSYPVIIAVALFHIVFAWNDYFEPLLYTLGKPDLQPISVGIQQFNFIYSQQPHLIQATALLGMILPVLLFFFSQRFFMRGVVITGVDK